MSRVNDSTVLSRAAAIGPHSKEQPEDQVRRAAGTWKPADRAAAQRCRRESGTTGGFAPASGFRRRMLERLEEETMDPTTQLDAAGRRRSPATLPGYHCGRAPGNKGRRYPADPPRVEEIIAVMRQAGERPAGLRVRGLIVVLWRAGLRVSEALALTSRSPRASPRDSRS